MDRKLSYQTIRKRFFLIGTAIVFLTVAVFAMDSRGLFLPSWIPWREKKLDTDPELQLVLEHRQLKIYQNDELVQTIGGKILVQDMLVTDLDRDGDTELVLLTWKKGKYGSSQPFWVKENTRGWSQHIFIYDLNNDGSTVNKWFSSDNGTDIVRFKVMEQNTSILLMEDTEGKNTLWHWDSWGLKNMENQVCFLAFGDNLIHDTIYSYAEREYGGNFDFLYEDVTAEIKNADFAALQMESILVDQEAAVSSYPYFGSPLAVGEAICDAGFNIVCCAGNHAADKGIYGINVTERFFTGRNVTVLGIQNGSDETYLPCCYVSRNGIRFALFDYTYGSTIDMREKYPYAVHYLEEAQIRKDLEECDADFKVVFVHWGSEYTDVPDEQQRAFAKCFAGAGADVVIGSHPHVIQPAELLPRPDGRDTLVVYSLGNFRAQQAFDERAMLGEKLRFTVEHCWEGVRIREWSIEEFTIPEYR